MNDIVIEYIMRNPRVIFIEMSSMLSGVVIDRRIYNTREKHLISIYVDGKLSTVIIIEDRYFSLNNPATMNSF